MKHYKHSNMEKNVYFHIRALYAIIFIVLVIFCGGFGFCIQQIFVLRSLHAEINPYFKYTNNEHDSKVNQFDDKTRSSLEQKEASVDLENNEILSRNKRAPSGGMITTTKFTSEEIAEHCRSLYEFCDVHNQGPPGPPGPKGNKGELGNPGLRGLKGTSGINGIPGARGPEGIKGEAGIRGPAGEKGNVGDKGNNGLLGFPGFKGATGPSGDKGDKGDMGFNGRPGPIGPRGPPGVEGPVGPEGRRGRRGPKGSQGDYGVKGSKGDPGYGSKGDRGERGMPGYGVNCTCPRGQKGEPGQRGLIGFTGYKGDKGDPGMKGNLGYGLRGYPGEKGQKGEKGDVAVFSSIAMQSMKITKQETPRATSRPERTPETREKETTTMESTTVSTTTPLPTIEPRKRACRVKQIGIPLFQREAGPRVGTWMADRLTSDIRRRNMIWVTKGNYGSRLREYRSYQNFRQNRVDRTFNLRIFKFFGTNHAIFNGSFYYQWAGRNTVVRFDLSIGDVSHAHEFKGSSYNNSKYLYSGNMSYFDIEVDENGLWVIYSENTGNNSIHVAKMDPMTLEVQKVSRIGVPRGSVGNAFISCGIIYLIDNTMARHSVIKFAYDLYSDKQINLGEPIVFRNPFGGNSMVSYTPDSKNAKDTRIYGWDNGRQITYQMRF